MISAGSAGLQLGTSSQQNTVGQLGEQIGSSVVSSFLGHITGSGTDAYRAAREQWTSQMAQRGSPTAAALILSAPANVSGNEASGWRAVVGSIPPDVMQAAIAQYGADGASAWPAGQPDFYNNPQSPVWQRIVSEISAASNGNSASALTPPSTVPVGTTSTVGAVTGTGVGTRPQTLPAVVTTATRPTTNYVPWIVAGAGVLIVVVLLLTHRRRA